MKVEVGVVLVLLGLSVPQVLADPIEVVEEDTECTMIELSTLMSEEVPPPEFPPEGFLSNIGLEMTIRDHLMFSVQMCDEATVVLTPTAIPMETSGYRLQIKSTEVVLGEIDGQGYSTTVVSTDADFVEMTCDMPQQFFLRWGKGIIEFGVGWDYEEDENVMLSLTVESLQPIRYAGVGGTSNNGLWQICQDAAVTIPKCGKADIAIAIDLSMSMDPDLLRRYAAGFVERLVKRLMIGPDDTQVGLVTFQSRSNVEFKFDEVTEADEIIRRVYNVIQYRDWGTCIGGAMSDVKNVLYDPANGARADVDNIFVMISDGINNDIDANAVNGPSLEAANMLDSRIETYCLGLPGSGHGSLNSAILQLIAYPDNNHYYQVINENTLDEAILAIRERIGCFAGE